MNSYRYGLYMSWLTERDRARAVLGNMLYMFGGIGETGSVSLLSKYIGGLGRSRQNLFLQNILRMIKLSSASTVMTASSPVFLSCTCRRIMLMTYARCCSSQEGRALSSLMDKQTIFLFRV